MGGEGSGAREMPGKCPGTGVPPEDAITEDRHDLKGTPTQIDSPVVLDRLGTWLVALRVQHWTKSGFCLAALFFHGDAFDHAAWSSVLPLLLMFSLVSSAGYLFNDILNLGEDRLHPRKCSRPIARGAIRTESAWVAILILYAGGMGLGVAIYGFGKTTTAVGCYVLLSLTYSLWLRAVPVVDVLVVAAGFVLRVAAGSYALQTLYPDVYPTPWLLGCTYALALLLGFGKRKGEESLLQHEHQAFGPTRRTLRAYRPRLLNVLAVCSACDVLPAASRSLAFRLERGARGCGARGISSRRMAFFACGNAGIVASA
jgi:decaprenyl-phosphate phosphoribosyltransferase